MLLGSLQLPKVWLNGVDRAKAMESFQVNFSSGFAIRRLFSLSVGSCCSLLLIVLVEFGKAGAPVA